MLQYPRPSLRSARVVVGALLAGPLAFFGLASFLIGHFGGGMLPADAELTPGQAFWIWVAIAIGCFVPALMLRSRVVSRVEASRFVSDPVEASEALGEIQTYLVIAGALIEMPALLGGVFFLLYAASDFLWVGLAGRVMGPVGSRIAGAVAGAVAGVFAQLGLELTPEVQAAAGELGQSVALVVTLAVYGIVHKKIEQR